MVLFTLKKAALVLAFAAFFMSFGLIVSLFLTFAAYLCTGGYKNVYVIMTTLPRDVRILCKLINMAVQIQKTHPKTIADIFKETAKKFPNKNTFVCAETGKKLTFKECQHLITNVAKAFQRNGYKKGDHVALFMENDVEYVPIWMGLSKIGVITALINTNLQGKSLEHCLSIVQFKGIIYGVNLENSLCNIGFFEKENLDFYVVNTPTCIDHHKASFDFHQFIQQDTSPTMLLTDEADLMDPVLYIYTSGSTGKPKAALIRRRKICNFLVGFSALPGITPGDVVYNCLPFYHSSGGLCFCSPVIYYGCTVILRKKFSASRFIEDCRQHGVTYAGYIGELWRYVLAQPPRDSDKNHKIRVISGNGLRRSLYKQVQDRFGIKDIREFYGATEGNVGFMNCDNKEGAVGSFFTAFPFLNSAGLVKCDVETGELIRNEEGLAIKCGVGEPGMIVASILTNRQFYDGYVNNDKETQKKVAENVFKKGDKVFLSGDLLERDEFDYLYFVDRIGDTFRWKSENVSTTEVENVISLVTPTIDDAVVYPVEIPGHEGKAGMAYLLEKSDVNFMIDQFAEDLLKHLPRYALPMFVRVGKSVDKTGTFKYQKFTLKQQGFNIDLCDPDDKFYVFDVKMSDYRTLDKSTFNEIQAIKMRF